VRGDVAVLVPEQQFPGFEAYAGGPQTASVGVLQIVHPNVGKGRWARAAKCCFVLCGCLAPCSLPSRIVEFPGFSGDLFCVD